MSGHTPGPWAVGGGTGRINQVSIEPSIGCAYGAGDEVLANARLIASAPELLEALKAARDALYWAVRAGCDLPEFDPCEHTVIKQIDAAIAKAQGQP